MCVPLCGLKQVTYINGSPQNTFVPGVIELAEKKRVFIGGDDFKSGQTKIKVFILFPCSVFCENWKLSFRMACPEL